MVPSTAKKAGAPALDGGLGADTELSESDYLPVSLMFFFLTTFSSCTFIKDSESDYISVSQAGKAGPLNSDAGNDGPAARIRVYDYGEGTLYCRFFVRCGLYHAYTLPPDEMPADGVLLGQNGQHLCTAKAGDIFFQKRQESDATVGSSAWLFMPMYSPNTGLTGNGWEFISPDFSGTYSKKISHPLHNDLFLAYRPKVMQPCWVKGASWDGYKRKYENSIKQK